jgi:Putative translation initiation inhibitor, yjgF family
VPGGVVAETEQIFSNAAAVLRAAGLAFDDVVSVRVFLTRIEDYQAMNAIYARHFTAPFPARTAVGVAALPLGACVEIDMIAKA